MPVRMPVRMPAVILVSGAAALVYANLRYKKYNSVLTIAVTIKTKNIRLLGKNRTKHITFKFVFKNS